MNNKEKLYLVKLAESWGPFKLLDPLLNKTVAPVMGGVGTSVIKPIVKKKMEKIAPGGKFTIKGENAPVLRGHDVNVNNIKVDPKVSFKFKNLLPRKKEHISISADSTIDLRKPKTVSPALASVTK